MVLKFSEYISYIKIKRSGPSSWSLHEKKCILLSVMRMCCDSICRRACCDSVCRRMCCVEVRVLWQRVHCKCACVVDMDVCTLVPS